eukprot:7056231-Pyramimonas_sp.AAC.1
MEFARSGFLTNKNSLKGNLSWMNCSLAWARPPARLRARNADPTNFALKSVSGMRDHRLG